MNYEEALGELGQACGILPDFYDLNGTQRVTTAETYSALLTAEGYQSNTLDDCLASLCKHRETISNRWFPFEVIISSGMPWDLSFGLGAEWSVVSCDDGNVVADGRPADFIALPSLPSGVYELRAFVADRQENVRIIAAPAALPSIENITGRSRLWGLTLAIYGLTSQQSTGLGSYSDLGRVAALSGKKGADFLGINPVHNMGYADAVSLSPYSPSHRGFLNTEYIALTAVPGLETSKAAKSVCADLNRIFKAERATKEIRHIAHKEKHNKLLRTLFKIFEAEASDAAKHAFTDFMNVGGAQIKAFSEFEAHSSKRGSDWREWSVSQDEIDDAELTFHAWLQWIADEQLASAQSEASSNGMGLGLYLDLAVGPRRGGAEAWCERGCIAPGVSIGAPPDHLSPAGQNWNLAAYSPRRLQAKNYAPLRRILAQVMRHAGVVRIDHVLGLNRSFWIPDTGAPGAYIAQPFQSLLAIIKIEAERSGTAVIGEDLGLVPEGFRKTMRENGFYGYSVLQYEKRGVAFPEPAQLPSQVLSCFATHDTPTIRGYEAGIDIDWWAKLDWIDEPQIEATADARSADVEALKQFGHAAQTVEMPTDDSFNSLVHFGLAHSPAAMLSVQLDDVLGAVEAQNLPGTIDEHPNWRRKYQVSVENLEREAWLDKIADIMIMAGRASSGSSVA